MAKRITKDKPYIENEAHDMIYTKVKRRLLKSAPTTILFLSLQQMDMIEANIV